MHMWFMVKTCYNHIMFMVIQIHHNEHTCNQSVALLGNSGTCNHIEENNATHALVHGCMWDVPPTIKDPFTVEFSHNFHINQL